MQQLQSSSLGGNPPRNCCFLKFYSVLIQSTSSARCYSSGFDQLTSNGHVDGFGHSQSEPLSPSGAARTSGGAAPSQHPSATHRSVRRRGDARPRFSAATPAPRSHTLDRSHHLWMTLFINKIQSALLLAAAPAFVAAKLHLKWCRVSPVASFWRLQSELGVLMAP